jgi:hypothetical protein
MIVLSNCAKNMDYSLSQAATNNQRRREKQSIRWPHLPERLIVISFTPAVSYTMTPWFLDHVKFLKRDNYGW